MNTIKFITLSFLSIVLFISCDHATHSEADSASKDSPIETVKKIGINFHEGNWDSALAKAKSENKLIFLDISASWCGPCKMLKKKTFSDSTVGSFYDDNFISVEVDGEKGEGINLAQQYKIEAYPSLFFINGEGTVVSKAMGFLPPEQFIQFGESVLNKE